jgi:hypothetical protein
LRHPADRRCYGEADQPADERPLAPEQVAELAAQQQEAAERKRISGDDPLTVIGREVQCLLRGRQCDVDDRHIEHNHELRDTHEGEHGPAVGRWPGGTVDGVGAHGAPSDQGRRHTIARITHDAGTIHLTAMIPVS